MPGFAFVYKYPIEISDEATIRMSASAKALTVQMQRGQPCIWALVDPFAPLVDWTVRVVGTGQPTNNLGLLDYIGTFQMGNGDLVFHVWTAPLGDRGVGDA